MFRGEGMSASLAKAMRPPDAHIALRVLQVAHCGLFGGVQRAPRHHPHPPIEGDACFMHA